MHFSILWCSACCWQLTQAPGDQALVVRPRVTRYAVGHQPQIMARASSRHVMFSANTNSAPYLPYPMKSSRRRARLRCIINYDLAQSRVTSPPFADGQWSHQSAELYIHSYSVGTLTDMVPSHRHPVTGDRGAMLCDRDCMLLSMAGRREIGDS